MRKFLFAFIFLLPIIHQIQAQWEWQFPVPQGNTLNDFVFLDADKGYAVGDFGTFITTDDRGSTWSFDRSLTTKHLRAVHFFHEGLGYIAGDSGLIMRYDGAGWTEKPTGTLFHVRDIDFISEQTGIAVGYKGLIMSMNNDNWEIVETSYSVTFHAVHYFTDQIIVAVGNQGTVVRSADGGKNWSKITTPTDEHFYDVYAPSESTGYIVGNFGIILKTTDGGSTWTDISHPVLEYDLYGVNFKNNTLGTVCGENGLILHTVNGGAFWDYEGMENSLTLNHIYPPFVSPADTTACDTMITCGSYGTVINIYPDSCAGETEFLVGTDRDLSKLTFQGNMGFAVGGDPFTNKPLMMQTKDGQNWEEIVVDTVEWYTSDVDFIDDSIGFISGYNGKIYKSTNGGSDWLPVVTDALEARLTSINASPINDSVMLGWVAGFNGALLTNSIGDSVWETIETPTERHLFGLGFYNPYNGFALGEQGTLLKISKPDNLIYVNNVFTGVNVALYDIAFRDDTLAFLVGFNGSIFKFNYKTYTQPIPIQSGVTSPLNEISFPHPDTGYIVGNGGLVLRSTDGGETWLPLLTRTANNLRGVYFKNGLTGYAIGAGGTILYTQNGGGEPFIPNSIDELTEESELLHVYPNPNRGSFGITLQVPSTDHVKAVIYDLAGKPSMTLLDQELYSGEHRLQVNADRLPHGVYILLVTIGQNRYTGKVVVMD